MKIYVLCIILQLDVVAIKVENDTDVESEEDSVGMKTHEVYLPSAFCVVKAEPEVSLSCDGFIWWWDAYVCVCVCVCVFTFLQYMYNMTSVWQTLTVFPPVPTEYLYLWIN